eukprot:CAMPEP_0119558062 /NCGR_PEP_ID=MMETSP1352-20130426/9961_1 /TAXON_ID=265584 /ORGANISM="Stauroneis constricta, Strain CCMP1120" /LENGTH=286 /DNA_ID=CAMNT_0007605285 /DNA_START=90 /DNA_END=950 /DNA_ORIENTATION=+
MAPFRMDSAITSYNDAIEAAAAGDPERDIWIKDPTFDQARHVMGRSFAGNEKVKGEPMCMWARSHLDDFKWYTAEMHAETMAFGMGFPIFKSFSKQKQTMTIARRDVKSGELVSAAIIEAFDMDQEKANMKNKDSLISKIQGGWLYAKTLTSLLMSGKVPELFEKKEYKPHSEYLVAKLEANTEKCDASHLVWGPKERHWHVRFVGVDPAFNGRGHGRELMEKISALADEQSVACYLEAGLRNRGFYEKMGYVVVSEVTVDDPVDATRESFRGVLMIRPKHGGASN